MKFDASGSSSGVYFYRLRAGDFVQSNKLMTANDSRLEVGVSEPPKDAVICAWDGKDDTLLKSGEKITFNPHAYTMVFKKIAGQWKVIYSHDSGIPVTQKAMTK